MGKRIVAPWWVDEKTEATLQTLDYRDPKHLDIIYRQKVTQNLNAFLVKEGFPVKGFRSPEIGTKDLREKALHLTRYLLAAREDGPRSPWLFLTSNNVKALQFLVDAIGISCVLSTDWKMAAAKVTTVDLAFAIQEGLPLWDDMCGYSRLGLLSKIPLVIWQNPDRVEGNYGLYRKPLLSWLRSRDSYRCDRQMLFTMVEDSVVARKGGYTKSIISERLADHLGAETADLMLINSEIIIIK